MDRKFFSLRSMTVVISVICILSAVPASLAAAQATSVYQEAPMLAKMVKAGALPPVDQRLPQNPMLIQPEERVGVYGGTWHYVKVQGDNIMPLIRNIQYEGLVRWDPAWTKVIPNLDQSFEVSADSKEFTFHLRRGIRWSDGAPFTADDILFWYQAVYLKPELKHNSIIFLNGLEKQLKVEKVDDYTVVFRFEKPFGLFLQQMATMYGTLITMYPKHYLQQFHPGYNPDIATLIKQEGARDWVELFNKHQDGSMLCPPGTPVLFPWILEAGVNVGAPASEKFNAVRNPYYWKIDTDFNQLPYIDRVEFTVVKDTEAATALAIAGQVDMQDRRIIAAAFTPEAMKKGGYGTFQLVDTSSNVFVIFFNQTVDDPVKREIFQNRDFRIGLSYAINRSALIAESGLDVKPFQVAPVKGTPFYNEQMATQYTEYNVDKANQYLDTAGYRKRDAEGFRLGPDGKRIRFTLILSDPFAFKIDDKRYASLIQGDWRAVGVEMQVKLLPRAGVDALVTNGTKEFNQYEAMVWGGDGGYDVILNPSVYLPLGYLHRFAPRWSVWYQNPQDPNAQEPPAFVQQQYVLYRQLVATNDTKQQEELMKQILAITTEQFYEIGIHSEPVGYGVVQSNFHNVPPFIFGSWTYPNPAPTNPCQYFIDPQK